MRPLGSFVLLGRVIGRVLENFSDSRISVAQIVSERR
jgi:hypothetical protein